MKNMVVFYYDAKIITEMRKKLLTRGGLTFCETFTRGINRQKLTSSYLFMNGAGCFRLLGAEPELYPQKKLASSSALLEDKNQKEIVLLLPFFNSKIVRFYG